MTTRRVIATAIVLAAPLLATAGCRARERAAAVDTTTPARIERATLAMFAPLPSVMTATGHPSTPARVALGRMLYYEPLLSDGHDLSCNGCHALNGYGADGRRVSFGHKGQQGTRNSPTVYNAALQVAQFWDGRAPDVEAQAKGPILNSAEMGMPDTTAVLAHLRALPRYQTAFRAAFPGQREPVNYDNVGIAIGAFERGLVTPSRWDRFLQGDSAALTPAEQRGLATFATVGCTSCHNGPGVGGGMLQKLGVREPWPVQTDSGRYTVTKRPEDVMVFKVALLRNVAKTGPYFHDGSVASLDSAVRLMARYQLGRDLGDAQVKSIVAYLESLTGEIPVAYIAEPQLPKK